MTLLRKTPSLANLQKQLINSLSSAVNWKAPHFILLLENKSATAETLNLKIIQHFYPTLLKTELQGVGPPHPPLKFQFLGLSAMSRETAKISVTWICVLYHLNFLKSLLLGLSPVSLEIFKIPTTEIIKSPITGINCHFSGNWLKSLELGLSPTSLEIIKIAISWDCPSFQTKWLNFLLLGLIPISSEIDESLRMGCPKFYLKGQSSEILILFFDIY